MRHLLLLSASVLALVAMTPQAWAQDSSDAAEAAVEAASEQTPVKVEGAPATATSPDTSVPPPGARTALEQLPPAADDAATPPAPQMGADATTEGAPAAAEAVPPEQVMENPLLEVAEKDGDFDTFLELMTLAGKDKLLIEKGPYTLFAPTDDAFDDMDAALLDELRNPENMARLVDFLSYHIVEGRVDTAALDNNNSQVVTTTLKRLRVIGKDGKLIVNGHDIDGPELAADNGIIHKVEHVIDSEDVPPVVTEPSINYPEPPAPVNPDLPAVGTPSEPVRPVAPEVTGGEPVPPPGVPEPRETADKKPWWKFW